MKTTCTWTVAQNINVCLKMSSGCQSYLQSGRYPTLRGVLLTNKLSNKIKVKLKHSNAPCRTTGNCDEVNLDFTSVSLNVWN